MLVGTTTSDESMPWLDPHAALLDRPVVLFKAQIAPSTPQRQGITYFRLLQLLVERPLAITVDDVRTHNAICRPDRVEAV